MQDDAARLSLHVLCKHKNQVYTGSPHPLKLRQGRPSGKQRDTIPIQKQRFIKEDSALPFLHLGDHIDLTVHTLVNVAIFKERRAGQL